MKNRIRVSARIFSAAAVIAGIGLLIPGDLGLGGHSGLAHAFTCKSGMHIPDRERRRAQTISIQTNKKLERVQVAFEEKNYAEAAKIIGDLKRRRISEYELAMVAYFEGALFYEQENLAGAIRAYELVLATPNLSWNFHDSVKFTIAQLNFAVENYRKSIQLLNEWLVYKCDPPISAFMFKGQAFYALEEYRNSLKQILIAKDMNTAAGHPTKENTYLLLRSIYFELKDLPNVRNVLEKLIINFPSKAEYWLQLSAIYSELREEKNQLAAMEVAYQQGYFAKETHYVNLAQLYLYNEVPIKAVKVLEDGFKQKIVEENKRNLETYSQSLMMAKEFKRAVDPLARAAKLSDNGELYIRLAQVNIELDKHADAIKAIQAGLKKGKLDRSDRAQTLLGMSYYNVDKLEDATKAFREAAKDKRSRKAATQWINYLRKESDRRRKLANALKPIRRTVSP